MNGRDWQEKTFQPYCLNTSFRILFLAVYFQISGAAVSLIVGIFHRVIQYLNPPWEEGLFLCVMALEHLIMSGVYQSWHTRCLKERLKWWITVSCFGFKGMLNRRAMLKSTKKKAKDRHFKSSNMSRVDFYVLQRKLLIPPAQCSLSGIW